MQAALMNRHHRHPECNPVNNDIMKTDPVNTNAGSVLFPMKEKSFLQRRKILKKINALEMTPVRLMEHEILENGKANILYPRFSKRIWSKLLQPSWKDKYIRIKLDEFGTATWLLIDGNSNVGKICTELKSRFPGTLEEPDLESRVSKFLTILYEQRYISFREVMKEE
jgi:hypothetical protein